MILFRIIFFILKIINEALNMSATTLYFMLDGFYSFLLVSNVLLLLLSDRALQLIFFISIIRVKHLEIGLTINVMQHVVWCVAQSKLQHKSCVGCKL